MSIGWTQVDQDEDRERRDLLEEVYQEIYSDREAMLRDMRKPKEKVNWMKEGF